MEPKLVRTPKGELWIRFYENEDRRGQFLDFVARLYAAGCSVRQSSVHTIEGLGVYDWFQVRTRKSPAQVYKQLHLLADARAILPPEKLRFQRVELVSRREIDAIIAFRGEDQRGMLLAAARALFEVGLSVKWAKVHTWGQQVDDIFCVKMRPTFDRDLESLRARLAHDSAASYQV